MEKNYIKIMDEKLGGLKPLTLLSAAYATMYKPIELIQDTIYYISFQCTYT